MKKIWLIVCFFAVLLGAAGWYFAQRLDFKKVVFVLPSSQRISSPYYYKADGDFFLADDLKQGLEKLGYEVSYRFREDYDDLELGNAGNVIYFKGYYDFQHLPTAEKKDGRKRVLYVYYIEGLNQQILNESDAVASASERFLDEFVRPLGVAAYFVPQYTNPDRFKQALKDDTLSFPILFVGSNHTGQGRLSVNYAQEAGADYAVFGKFWETRLSPEHLKGTYIDNNELYKYYGNAGIVLNDHRADMRYYGFVSNRVYDVTASGGFVFTDYLPEIEAAYGDSVAMYKDYEDYVVKLNYYLSHPEERQKMAEKAREITLKYYTNDVAAKKFDNIFKNIKK